MANRDASDTTPGVTYLDRDGDGEPVTEADRWDQWADRSEERLRVKLREQYDREPTEGEIRWARRFPKRVAGLELRRGEWTGHVSTDPRLPSFTEMRDALDWGATKAEKRRGSGETYGFSY